MRKIVSFGFLAAALLLLASCAKEKTPDEQTLQRASFDAWMSLYGDGAERQGSGMYVKKLVNSTKPGAKTPTNEDQWVRINYTGRALLTGDIYVSRDPEVAKHQGTFEDFIHYTPDYLAYYPIAAVGADNYYMPQGFYLALGQMKEGDIWRLYIPSDLAYGLNGYTNTESSFSGQNSLASNTPVIVDLEFVELVEDPEALEKEQVREYAISTLGLSFADEMDSCIYYKSVDFVTEDRIKIKDDSIVQYYYVGRFFDGFVFDTNVKDTADKYNLAQYNISTFYDLPDKARAGASKDESTSSDNMRVVSGLDSAFLHMYYGEHGIATFTSNSLYGKEGLFSTSSASFPPYTPVIFEVWSAPRHGNGTSEFPYDIEAIQQSTVDEQGVWVVGYSMGIVTGDDVSEWAYGYKPDTDVRDNVMISNATSVGDYRYCIPIQLATQLQQDELNPVDNTFRYSTRTKYYGDIATYKGARGLVNLRAFKTVYKVDVQ